MEDVEISVRLQAVARAVGGNGPYPPTYVRCHSI